MIGIPIQSISNQQFQITLENDAYTITLRSGDGMMYITIVKNTVTILQNSRCVAGYPLIPYNYLETGNFVFFTQNQELPNYAKFNITQNLVYLTSAEIALYAAPTVAPIVAADFNPLGALPLRFSPKGYT